MNNKRRCANELVSIRALARRATSSGQHTRHTGTSFNSCPRAEGNHPVRRLRICGCCFNSCPRAEGNPGNRKNPRGCACFNSCPRAEGNQIRCHDCHNKRHVSIRALARRATAIVIGGVVDGRFQFVPSRGGQRAMIPAVDLAQLFQFVPSRGGQRSIQPFTSVPSVSIRALARRAT